MHFYSEIIVNAFLNQNHLLCIFIEKSFLMHFYINLISNAFI